MKKYLIWLPPILWMGLIFLLSAQTGHQSSRTSKLLLDFFALLSFHPSSEDAALLTFLFRKLAHFTEYFILALLLFAPVRRDVPLPPAAAVLAICIAYAASDEWHQTMVPGRTGLITDVIIDAAGASAGLLVAYWRKRKREKV